MEFILDTIVRLPCDRMDAGMDESIREIIAMKNEGKCTKVGYIYPDSIEIIKTSMGKYEGSQFDGKMHFNVIYKAKVLNPAIDEIISAEVVNINKFGIMAKSDPLVILMPHQYNPEPEIAERVRVGDNVNVKVKGKKFNIGEDQITVIGHIVT